MILPNLFKHRLLNWFHNFLLLTEIIDATALPKSIFKFSQLICQKSSQPDYTVGNVLSILLCCRQDSWKTLLEELYLVTLLVYYCEFMYRSFLICLETLREFFWGSSGLRLLEGKHFKQTRTCFAITLHF